MVSPPLVFSISYGEAEFYVSDSEVVAFSNMAVKLGARGVTLVASSGDDGAVDSIARLNSSYCFYAPDFPASSPFVVAVVRLFYIVAIIVILTLSYYILL